MNSKHLALALAGFALTFPVYSAENVFEGFGKPWQFYGGTKFSEKKDSVTVPVRTGGMYISVRNPLTSGAYARRTGIAGSIAVPTAENRRFQKLMLRIMCSAERRFK